MIEAVAPAHHALIAIARLVAERVVHAVVLRPTDSVFRRAAPARIGKLRGGPDLCGMNWVRMRMRRGLSED